ncbi:MAG: potassium-transporting ATPase subunit C [Thiothrix sp.]|nr:potassium-transporting ATPase subunit C [Thiothrix sp.]
MLNSVITGLRISIASMVICVGGYASIVWAVGQTLTPFTANGAILTNESGQIIGSRQVAQAFTRPEYLWPRPSAVDYDGAGAGGSNWSPTSDMVRERGTALVAAHGATPDNPLPADLATASGAGLDPHVSEAAALYQAARVAEARGVPIAQVEALIRGHATSPGAFLTGDRIVNVLEVNLALDRM